jgi:hypothetical protein
VRESESVVVLTGTSGTTSVNMGTLLDLYRFPQVKLAGMEQKQSETMLTLVLFSDV